MTSREMTIEQLWTPDGWRADVGLGAEGSSDTARLEGFWIPGIPNTHSHAFQRAMAGMAEYQTAAADSFWTWREQMYAFAERMDPDSLYAVASQLYVEMLQSGYTSVCEFHYLHHAPDGRPYGDPAAMSRAIIAAAGDSGIGLTLLPVLYQCGGFDDRPLSQRQRRFSHDTDAYLQLIESLIPEQSERLRIGVCFHSLRAVSMAAMRMVLDALPSLGGSRPIHLHIAEQPAEVADCIQAHGARPVRHLLDSQPLDANWTLVHATHLDDSEVRDLAATGATVSICPTTEANLGDGLFALDDWRAVGGRWSIGSDSHISVSPVEELRWLEYGQRLKTGRRNVCVGDVDHAFRRHVGNTLLSEALQGGALASGRSMGCESGNSEDGLDLVRLDDRLPTLFPGDSEGLIDRWIFSGNAPAVRDVLVGSEFVVRDGVHRDHSAIATRYRKAISALQT